MTQGADTIVVEDVIDGNAEPTLEPGVDIVSRGKSGQFHWDHRSISFVECCGLYGEGLRAALDSYRGLLSATVGEVLARRSDLQLPGWENTIVALGGVFKKTGSGVEFIRILEIDAEGKRKLSNRPLRAGFTEPEARFALYSGDYL